MRNHTCKAQSTPKYSASRTGAEAAFATGYDSGVGLTQKPSMQTMRALHSRSGEASDSGDTRAVSVFSNTGTGTSCSNTTEPSCIQSSSHSPRQDELQSIAGATITRCTQDHSTKAFLTEGSLPDPPPYKESTNPEETKVFLNATSTITNLSAETLISHPSPSLGLSRFPGHNETSTESTSNSPQLSAEEKYLQNRSIIIDSNGRTRFLSPNEESQRNDALHQAVLARMRPSFMSYTPARDSQQEGKRQEPFNKPCNQHRELEKAKLPTSTSKLGLSWSRHKCQVGTPRKLKEAVPLVGKLGKLFSRERSA